MTDVSGAPLAVGWRDEVLDQLEWWWAHSFRPRIAGLTDEEYFWEPVPGCWNVRRLADGGCAPDWAHPAPEPPPVTTIAWRLVHIGSGIFAVRNADHFGGPPWDMWSHHWPSTADDALAWVDDGYERWTSGVRSLSDEQLAAPIGPTGGHWADHAFAGLVLHINREVIHHGAEVCVLRDLYRARC